MSRQSAQHATILGAIVAPTSRGNVTLRSADTQDLPLINPNWLTAPADVELAIAMYKRMREIWATPAMRAVVGGGGGGGGEAYPGPGVQSDAQIHEQVKRSLTTVWHAACTCKMGRRDDAGAVLDARARVFGVGALRVVDASSFPTLPPGHPQSTVCGFRVLRFLIGGGFTDVSQIWLRRRLRRISSTVRRGHGGWGRLDPLLESFG